MKSTSILTCAAVAGALLCYLKCIDIYVLSARVQNSELVSEKNFVPPVRTSWEYTMLVMHNYAENHKS